MAWIESHQSLITHRKLLRASARLKVSKYLLIGHLHALWWWAIDNAEVDGALGQALDEELAQACGWPVKKAEEFVTALLEVGFIEKTSHGYALHNWYKYAGKLNEKREKDRRRKTEVAGSSNGIPVEVAGKSQAPTEPTDQPNLTNPTNHTQPTDRSERSPLRQEWENRIGFLASTDSKEFTEYEDIVPERWFHEAIEITTSKADRPSWAFCRSVLQRALETQEPPRGKQRQSKQKVGSVADALEAKRRR